MHPRSISSGRPAVSGKARSQHLRAFSLVEVTLAMGILSFALVGLMGLVSVGLSTFHSAVDNTVCTQIAQRIFNEAQQTDFDQLGGATAAAIRYFDEQGSELTSADKLKAVYQARLAVAPVTVLPGSGTNENLATVVVQIANNPGDRPILMDADGLWSLSADQPISNHSIYVARSK